MIETKPRCEACRFFEIGALKDKLKSTDEREHKLGICRRNPPSSDMPRGVWVVVSTADWCGEFKDR